MFDTEKKTRVRNLDLQNEHFLLKVKTVAVKLSKNFFLINHNKISRLTIALSVQEKFLQLNVPSHGGGKVRV